MTNLRPFLKMITSDYVGLVMASELRDGDVIVEGMVINVEKDASDGLIYFDTLDSLHALHPDAEVLRIARLTKVAYEDIAKPYYEEQRR